VGFLLPKMLTMEKLTEKTVDFLAVLLSMDRETAVVALRKIIFNTKAGEDLCPDD